MKSLNEFTFERFIVGPGNRSAYTAALAVSKNPDGDWNPLFLSGGTGAGKTHLLSAIAHQVAKETTGSSLVLVRATNFIDELINSIRRGEMAAFRSKYRDNCGGLLFDDIQFVSSKEATQLELLSVIDFLLGQGRRVVLASDRPPMEIENLDDGLRTRLESCFIIDIKPPDAKARLAILRTRAEERGVIIPDDVAAYLADDAPDVRRMENSLNRIMAIARFHECEISMNFVKNIQGGSVGIKPERQNKKEGGGMPEFQVKITLDGKQVEVIVVKAETEEEAVQKAGKKIEVSFDEGASAD